MTPGPSRKKDKTEYRKRCREWIIILCAIAAVVLLTRFETKIYEMTSQLPVSNSIVVLAVININILLIILFLFLVFHFWLCFEVLR